MGCDLCGASVGRVGGGGLIGLRGPGVWQL